MDLDHPHLPGFLSAQLRDHGGQAELDAGLWTLFAVPAADPDANALAQSLLRTAPFAHDSGQTEDDQWTLYYVDTANRPLALAWLDDTVKLVAGEIRPKEEPINSLPSHIGFDVTKKNGLAKDDQDQETLNKIEFG
jgi:hypothetical protein